MPPSRTSVKRVYVEGEQHAKGAACGLDSRENGLAGAWGSVEVFFRRPWHSFTKLKLPAHRVGRSKSAAGHVSPEVTGYGGPRIPKDRGEEDCRFLGHLAQDFEQLFAEGLYPLRAEPIDFFEAGQCIRSFS